MEGEIKEKIPKIEGYVEITNGKTHITAKNKFLNAMIQSLANYIGNTATDVYGMNHSGITLKIGTDTTTSTTASMTALVDDLSIAPSSKTSTVGQVSSGVWDITFTQTWNAGTISDGTQIGELGLYSSSVLTVTNDNNATSGLITRLSVADNDFSAFTVDASSPLTIAYTIRLTA